MFSYAPGMTKDLLKNCFVYISDFIWDQSNFLSSFLYRNRFNFFENILTSGSLDIPLEALGIDFLLKASIAPQIQAVNTCTQTLNQLRIFHVTVKHIFLNRPPKDAKKNRYCRNLRPCIIVARKKLINLFLIYKTD